MVYLIIDHAFDEHGDAERSQTLVNDAAAQGFRVVTSQIYQQGSRPFIYVLMSKGKDGKD